MEIKTVFHRDYSFEVKPDYVPSEYSSPALFDALPKQGLWVKNSTAIDKSNWSKLYKFSPSCTKPTTNTKEATESTNPVGDAQSQVSSEPIPILLCLERT